MGDICLETKKCFKKIIPTFKISEFWHFQGLQTIFKIGLLSYLPTWRQKADTKIPAVIICMCFILVDVISLHFWLRLFWYLYSKF